MTENSVLLKRRKLKKVNFTIHRGFGIPFIKIKAYKLSKNTFSFRAVKKFKAFLFTSGICGLRKNF